jgi:hypothetical protein
LKDPGRSKPMLTMQMWTSTGPLKESAEEL